MFLFFLTLIPFNFLVRSLYDTDDGIHGVHTWVCSVIFFDILECKPTFLVFLLISNLVGFSLVGLKFDVAGQAWFLVCGGFIFCGILDCETTFSLEGNGRPKTAPGPQKLICFFSIFVTVSPLLLAATVSRLFTCFGTFHMTHVAGLKQYSH